MGTELYNRTRKYRLNTLLCVSIIFLLLLLCQPPSKYHANETESSIMARSVFVPCIVCFRPISSSVAPVVCLLR